MEEKHYHAKKKQSLNKKLISRRRFLKYGFWGTTAAVAATSTVQYLNQSNQEADIANNFSLLRPTDITMLSALIPIILAGALPADSKEKRQSVDKVIHNMEAALMNFSTANREQIMQLFDLLCMPFSRILTTGIWTRWEKTDPQKIDQFLMSWRNSRIGKLNLAYNALTQLIPSIWYGMAENWPQIGYPGPPPIK